MTIDDIYLNITGNGICSINSATIEIVDVGIIYLPMHIAVDLLQ